MLNVVGKLRVGWIDSPFRRHLVGYWLAIEELIILISLRFIPDARVSH